MEDPQTVGFGLKDFFKKHKILSRALNFLDKTGIQDQLLDKLPVPGIKGYAKQGINQLSNYLQQKGYGYNLKEQIDYYILPDIERKGYGIKEMDQSVQKLQEVYKELYQELEQRKKQQEEQEKKQKEEQEKKEIQDDQKTIIQEKKYFEEEEQEEEKPKEKPKPKPKAKSKKQQQFKVEQQIPKIKAGENDDGMSRTSDIDFLLQELKKKQGEVQEIQDTMQKQVLRKSKNKKEKDKDKDKLMEQLQKQYGDLIKDELVLQQIQDYLQNKIPYNDLQKNISKIKKEREKQQKSQQVIIKEKKQKKPK